MKNILITGATGFVGTHLIQKLLENKDYKIFAFYRNDNNLDNPIFKSNIEFIKIDLLDKDAIRNELKRISPDWIFHLAAQANVSLSFKDPINTFHTNIDSQINLFESIKDLSLNKKTKVFIVSSAEVYGHVDSKDLPIKENSNLNPTNPYSISKLATELLAKQYFLSFGIKTIIVRPFNHAGPGQKDSFVISSFANKIAKIEKGNNKPIINVGNLEAKRDFTDVRDVVKAYILLMEKGSFGEIYNIGSGISYKISDVLNKLISYSNIKIEVLVDETLFRPIDDPELVCNYLKLKNQTGWSPLIPFEKTLKDTLDYWRNII